MDDNPCSKTDSKQVIKIDHLGPHQIATTGNEGYSYSVTNSAMEDKLSNAWNADGGNKMTVPEQCKNCILLDLCIDNNCVKNKPCMTRLEPVPVDEDLLQEMKERIGF